MEEKIAKTTILSLSKFVEKPQEGLFGFTVIYKNGEMKNYFVKEKLYKNSAKIKKLKKLYNKFKNRSEL